MLEYNFTELDDDFITLWSRYLLSHDETQIAADLEKLAELGQINAIQSYYLFLFNAKKTETNREIDKRVSENYYSRNFNHLLAQAHRILATDVQDIVTLNDLIATYNLECEQADKLREKINLYSNPYNEKEEIIRKRLKNDLNQLFQSNESTINKIKNTRFWSKQHEAIMACIEYAESTHDAVVFERYFELATSSVGGQLKDVIESRELKHDAKVARKELAKRHKTNPTPAVDFALTKNLIFFSEKEKHFELGRKILTGLANRTLSKTLTEYKLKGTPTLANSVYPDTTTGISAD